MNWSLLGVDVRVRRRYVFITLLAMTMIASSSFFYGLLAAPGDGRMILFYDGATVPTGWSCVSCNPADPFYQRFVRGGDTYGSTGGSPTHTHTYSEAISSSNNAAVSEAWNSGAVAANSHSHTLATTFGGSSNLPSYRQLKVIRHDTNDEPSTIPEGAIAIFDSSSLPSNWTRYGAQDGSYVRGEDTVGTTGGANTHSHTITTTIGAATGADYGSRGGQQQAQAAALGHTHTATGSTSSVDTQPPFIEAVLARADTATPTPSNMIAMWDDEVPTGWQLRSGASDPFYHNFIKPATNFGATGGSETHSHANTSITTSGASAASGARSGGGGAADNHTHTVTLSAYSTANHMPPYIDVIFAKKQEPSDLSLAAYRWYRNRNDTDVGLALAAQDTVATSIGLPFRLRIAVEVDSEDLSISGESLKLQIAEQVGGTCDINFNDETYADVTQSSGPIRYYVNANPADGDPLTPNLNDPELVSGTAQAQTYIESNPFSNTESVTTVDDYALFDFSLFDHSSPSNTTYCFRVMYAGGQQLTGYTTLPELTTDDGQGNMVVLFDDTTVPADWTCVSCNPGEPFYQRFARGAASYGATGGSATHGHTATGTVNATIDSGGNTGTGPEISELGHGHTVTPVLADNNNLPPYRQLRFIRYDFSGTPTTLPEGSIALFTENVPAGWTRYAAQDGQYIRGEENIAATGGSLTHTHDVEGTLSPATGGTTTNGGGGPTSAGATPGHTHTLSGTAPSETHEPPYRETILGKLDADSSPPAGIVTFWDGSPPGSWDVLSNNGGDFYQRFVKPAASYGTVGGNEAHTHADHTASTSTPSASAQARRDGGGAAASHTHVIDVSNVSTDNHLPPYIDTVIAQQPVPNTPPNQPASLSQVRATLQTVISPDGYTNETEVHFEADVSDPDSQDNLELCVEVQPLTESFTGTEQACGSAVAYTGLAVTASVVISGLADTEEYHWQARARDGAGVYSDWSVFSGTGGTTPDFTIDTVDPFGLVYDGSVTGSDADFNDGSLDSASANWSIDSGLSGLDEYEYAIGTTAGGTDTVNWTSVGTDTSVSATGLDLATSEMYYVSVRTTDNAGNQSIISSDGQLVAPTLSFSVDTSQQVFDTPSPENSYTATEDVLVETSTNAHAGYEVRARATDLLSTQSLQSLGMFDGGTYAAPAEWGAGDTGFGFTSSDSLVGGINRFASASCLGGGSPPCYAPYTTAGDGYIIADNDGPVRGVAITNEQFTITNRVTIDPNQPAGRYRTTIIYTIRARY